MSDLERLRAMLDARALTFPIGDRASFVAQMMTSGAEVSFGGVQYETKFASTLLPSFFFPVMSLDDLLWKATELIASRGLVPVEAALQRSDAGAS